MIHKFLLQLVQANNLLSKINNLMNMKILENRLIIEVHHRNKKERKMEIILSFHFKQDKFVFK